jgi:galactonate dehydratase
MFITSIEALIIKMPGRWGDSHRLAPHACSEAGCQPLETVLARVTTDEGVTGWGESQATSAPEVARAIIHSILKPALEGKPFGGAGLEIETLWDAMYNRTRMSGQTGGFMLDAMAAVDIALWDLAGRIHGSSIASLIAGRGARRKIETYVDRLAGETAEERAECAAACRAAGCRRFQISYDSTRRELLENYDAMACVCGAENVAVDGLWRLDPGRCASLAGELDRRGALWLARPFAADDVPAHAALAARMRTPIAIGETHRTHTELAPFFRARAMRIVQPDLGRCGITEGLRIARAAERDGMEIAPRLSSALGPLLFATLQFAAAVPNCRFAPYAPGLLETANGFAAAPVRFHAGCYSVPAGPGLGVELMEPEVRHVAVA